MKIRLFFFNLDKFGNRMVIVGNVNEQCEPIEACFKFTKTTCEILNIEIALYIFDILRVNIPKLSVDCKLMTDRQREQTYDYFWKYDGSHLIKLQLKNVKNLEYLMKRRKKALIQLQTLELIGGIVESSVCLAFIFQNLKHLTITGTSLNFVSIGEMSSLYTLILTNVPTTFFNQSGEKLIKLNFCNMKQFVINSGMNIGQFQGQIKAQNQNLNQIQTQMPVQVQTQTQGQNQHSNSQTKPHLNQTPNEQNSPIVVIPTELPFVMQHVKRVSINGVIHGEWNSLVRLVNVERSEEEPIVLELNHNEVHSHIGQLSDILAISPQLSELHGIELAKDTAAVNLTSFLEKHKKLDIMTVNLASWDPSKRISFITGVVDSRLVLKSTVNGEFTFFNPFSLNTVQFVQTMDEITIGMYNVILRVNSPASAMISFGRSLIALMGENASPDRATLLYIAHVLAGVMDQNSSPANSATLQNNVKGISERIGSSPDFKTLASIRDTLNMKGVKVQNAKS